jgi:uncharacterized protein YtpQ (UPF0354 family)
MTSTQLILGGLGLVTLGLAVISFRKRRAPDPAQFTQEYIAHLKKIRPGAQVNLIGDLELEVILSEGAEPHRVFLDNAFRDYSQSPKNKSDILKHYASVLTETQNTKEIDPARILPVIRDPEFFEQANEVSQKSGNPSVAASDPFNEELYIMYVADSEHAVRYLSEADVAELKLDRTNLRTHAIENLRRLHPEVRVMGAKGLFMVQLDGTYESSLLLSKSLWEMPKFTVKGEFIVAVPTRDVLLITGTLEREGLEMMRNIVAEASSNGSYRISPKLFIRRDGRFEAWE